VVAGDGRCDLPGSSAKYCTYVILETEKSLIIHAETIDKREVHLKSPNVEREGLLRSLAFLRDKVTIEEVITDASSSVIKSIGIYGLLYLEYYLLVLAFCSHPVHRSSPLSIYVAQIKEIEKSA